MSSSKYEREREHARLPNATRVKVAIYLIAASPDRYFYRFYDTAF